MPGLLKQPRQAPQQAQPMPEEQAGVEDKDAQGQQVVSPQPEMAAGAEESGEEEKDPNFIAAVEFVKRSLYETGAADDINAAMKKSRNPVDDLAMMAYELTAIADEKTQGQVPDELLVLLASTVLTEVVEIAEASGISMEPADIAAALKQMILRYVGEMGYDTRELEAAMNQVSPEQINQVAAEA